MSLSATMKQYREAGLKPYQAKLVTDFLESPVPARRLLVAPPGLGKTFAAMSLAKQIAKANANYRFLVIGPSALTPMYQHHLAQALPDATVTAVTRRILRELEELADPGQPIWPTQFAAVISMDTARQDDVRAHLCSVTWDLVIVEESHRFARSRGTLLKAILSEDVFARVLLITGTPDVKVIAPLLKNVARTEWRATELKDWDDRPLFSISSPKFEKVAYQRSVKEVSLLRRVISLTRELSPTPVGQLVKKTLLRQATSSPLALERTVRNLRNMLAHSASEKLLAQSAKITMQQQDEELDTDSDIDMSSISARSPWQSKPKAFAILGALLDQLESVDRDTKREALEGLLLRLQENPNSRRGYICVLCSSRTTADYLQTALSDQTAKAWLLTSHNTPEQLNRELDGFKRDGGVLISTVAMLQGLDIRYVQALIHYDPPASGAEMYVRTTRSHAATNYVLEDKSGVVPDEWNVDSPSPSGSRK